MLAAIENFIRASHISRNRSTYTNFNLFPPTWVELLKKGYRTGSYLFPCPRKNIPLPLTPSTAQTKYRSFCDQTSPVMSPCPSWAGKWDSTFAPCTTVLNSSMANPFLNMASVSVSNTERNFWKKQIRSFKLSPSNADMPNTPTSELPLKEHMEWDRVNGGRKKGVWDNVEMYRPIHHMSTNLFRSPYRTSSPLYLVIRYLPK